MEISNVILKLSQIRTEKRMSAHELSLRLEKARGYIYDIEKGKNTLSLKMFLRICEILETDPKKLLGDLGF